MPTARGSAARSQHRARRSRRRRRGSRGAARHSSRTCARRHSTVASAPGTRRTHAAHPQGSPVCVVRGKAVKEQRRGEGGKDGNGSTNALVCAVDEGLPRRERHVWATHSLPTGSQREFSRCRRSWVTHLGMKSRTSVNQSGDKSSTENQDFKRVKVLC